LLRIRSLSKTYPGQVALDRASLDVRAGEVHALVGQNGSGKSTLIKILGGYVRADHGADVELAGTPVDLWHLSHEQRRHIRIVHQDLGLVPTLSTVENLGLGRGYLRGPFGNIRWRQETAHAQQALLRFGLAPDVRQPVATLTPAEQAAVAIVRAMQDWDTSQPGLLVLDEPTASLNRGEVEALFREVRRLAALGAGVLFVSHVLDEVLGLADRVTVLRDGQVVAAGESTATLDEQSLVRLIVGRPVDDLFPEPADRSGRPVLEAEMLYGITLRGVSLRVHAGEVVGVAGLVGSGRDEIAGALFGLTPRFAGKVLVDKRKVFASPRDSIRAGMALVPADRKGLGLHMEDRLVEHVPLPRFGEVLDHPASKWKLDHRGLRLDAAEWIEKLEVQPPLLDRRMEKFSGGNQQKAVLARWLRTKPKVLLLDEPTQGVDVGAKASIYHHVAEAARDGTAVLVTSSDPKELVHLCDRVLVLRAGMLVAELTGPWLTEEQVVAETLGATTNRQVMRVTHRHVRTRIVRTDDDLPPEPPEADVAPTTPVEAPVGPARGGRFAAWVRRVTHRLRGGG
jgi:ribose transport system ATP-binding protein